MLGSVWREKSKGESALACATVLDNGAVLLGSQADWQEVERDWLKAGCKQEANPCELPALGFPCQHTHTIHGQQF